MISYGGKYGLERAAKDVIYELRAFRNSVDAVGHFPESVAKCRELELFMKGILLEINEMDVEEDD